MRKLVLIIVGICALAGCKSTPSVSKAVAPLVYKIDIQQGNVITQEMVAKLHQSMTPAQVRYVLGSPLVIDPFHPDRWDYVYLYEKGHQVTEHHRLTVIFADGKLARLEGDVQLDTTLAPENAVDAPTPDVTPAATVSPAPAVPAPTGTPVTAPTGTPATGTTKSDAAQPEASTPASAAPAANNAKTD
jgi:outer membrane protein assembly factor BamE